MKCKNKQTCSICRQIRSNCDWFNAQLSTITATFTPYITGTSSFIKLLHLLWFTDFFKNNWKSFIELMWFACSLCFFLFWFRLFLEIIFENRLIRHWPLSQHSTITTSYKYLNIQFNIFTFQKTNKKKNLLYRHKRHKSCLRSMA